MTTERRIWHIGTVFTLLLLLVSSRLVYWQLVRGQPSQPGIHAEATAVSQATDESKGATPGTTSGATLTPEPPVRLTAIPTPTLDIAAITRGTIYDRNGRRLAYDLEGENGKLFRFYTEPSLAHVVGYVSGLRLGVTGIERSYDKQLFGLDDQIHLEEPGLNASDRQKQPTNAQRRVFLPLIVRGRVERPLRGNDVYLTIDSRIQRAVAQALNDKAAAIVVIDAQSGAVLAMASSPTFDPNRILDPDYIRELENCNGSVSCRQALFNRAAQGWYTPGSTWKTVTLIAALETGQVTPKTEFDFGSPLRDEKGKIYYVYTVDGFSIKDPNHQERRLDLVRSYAVSANAAFARIGDEMPTEVMIAYAARLGFSRQDDGRPPIEIDASAARLAVTPQELDTNNPLRASTAIGQGELLASPLSIALVTAAVVNDGDIPVPHLVQSVKDPSGNLLAGEPTGYWITDTMRPETAGQVREMMTQVVQNGSGARANVPGFVVGGKTGTAQVGDDALPHAWFTGFVQGDGRTIVITVIIENGGEGSQVAAPLFAQVAEVAMRHMGEPVEEVVPTPATPPATQAPPASVLPTQTPIPATQTPLASVPPTQTSTPATQTPLASVPSTQAPIPATQSLAAYQLLIAKEGEDSLFVVNVAEEGFPLTQLRLGEDNKGGVKGEEWGVETLKKGECVTAWKDKGNPRPPKVECKEVGQRLTREGKRIFWKSTFKVYYAGGQVGACERNQAECRVNIIK